MMEKRLLKTKNPENQRVNMKTTPTMMAKINVNHEIHQRQTQQQQQHQQNLQQQQHHHQQHHHQQHHHQQSHPHRKENINLCHIRCHPYNQQLKTTAATATTRKFSRTIFQNNLLNLVKQQPLWLIILLLITLINHHVESLEMTTTRSSGTLLGKSTTRYSQLLSTDGQMTSNDENVDNVADDDTFRPFMPKDAELLSRNVFTPSGQFRVFQPIDTDLRATVAMQQRSRSQQPQVNTMFEGPFSTLALKSSPSSSSPYPHSGKEHKSTKQQQQQEQHMLNVNFSSDNNLSNQQLHHANRRHDDDDDDISAEVQRNEITRKENPHDDLTSDFKNLEELLLEYVTNFFEKGQYEPVPGLVVELQSNHSIPLTNSLQEKIRNVRHIKFTDARVSDDLPRTMATGRLLFLTGLKKVLWPVFMGLQVLKSLLIAMFIPALIGSFTKLLGKGITQGSAPLFIRPMEPPQELDFRDNSINFEDDTKFMATDEGTKDNGPYAYNQPDASQMHNQYAYNPASANSLTFTRLGMNERQHQLMQDSYMSALQSIGSASFKNSGSLSSGSSGLLAPMANKPPPAANVNTFQQFQKVPDSSLLLSNYDPFYSPLLSRLDSVFGQLKINSDNEVCREKLICLMYANPAKYAPYSNLVSAQLSRELNELRKPTSDNPDILRFFKYMRAAKDGQDGVDCEKTFDKCTEFKDFENPAMVSTYHDINKLVQARKLT